MTIAWVVFVVLLLVLIPIALAGISFAPWVPTWQSDIDRALRLAAVKPGETVYDLGCGNGKVVFAAAKLGAHAVGIEIAWPFYLWCQVSKLIRHASLAHFKLGNLFKADLRTVDVVYVFGMPDNIKHKLAKKLLAELKPGSRVVSYAFHIPGLPNEYKDKPQGKMSVFVYRF
ncbi:MAG: class I SAM-dependent methyltransferase [Candidatus Kerfeldbacteria bacterium]|nr:class I SAM-dependent methyltransferase [Candidatus Kerfeldbacteria bacterium]